VSSLDFYTRAIKLTLTAKVTVTLKRKKISEVLDLPLAGNEYGLLGVKQTVTLPKRGWRN